MKHKIKLTEKKIRDVVDKTIKHILKEGFAEREMDEKWIDAERQLGSENMLQEVYNFFSGDQLESFLHSIDENYDMGLFEDEEEDYDEEEDDEGYSIYESYNRWKKRNKIQ